MASYNGISMKAYKTFRDHEGCEIAQANLYIGNKKIGFWSQDAWGGPDIIDLDAKYDIRKLEECCKERGMDVEFTMWQLSRMTEDEREWKKSGWKRMFVADDGYHMFMVGVKDPNATTSDILNIQQVRNYIDENFFKDTNSHVFRIVDESTVNDDKWPITIEDIKRS